MFITHFRHLARRASQTFHLLMLFNHRCFLCIYSLNNINAVHTTVSRLTVAKLYSKLLAFAIVFTVCMFTVFTSE